ncbi:hypothetical protein [Helicobacter sp. 11S03491-1]|uniref:hypothetical protein n=1 Tax=Helicobacter sp. 11S03491-1 TaxID=1476196 RepID=UPI000BA7C4B7|nr:hypothetical protein [Helicobacter sp. 11S03491-1]PAF43742.1 hypothetical protein BKH45_00280 [Helicobacter sp. 11S03491-1]
MKKIILSLLILLFDLGVGIAKEFQTDITNKTDRVDEDEPKKNTLEEKDKQELQNFINEKMGFAKKSKWDWSILGPVVISKMIDFKNNKNNFAMNGILDISVMPGVTYEMIQDLKIGFNVGIGSQFGINKVSYVLPLEIGLFYAFYKDYSIFGGSNYSYGGLINDLSLYVGINLKHYLLKIGYVPYAFASIDSSKILGQGFYFGFGGAF